MREVFDPFSPEVVADPYPSYRRLHERHPVYHNPRLDLWVLSKHADVAAAARASDRLSSADGVTYVRAPLPSILSMDPPGHTRLRKLVSREFTPRAVERRQEVIAKLVDTHLQPLLAAGGGDFVERVAAPLPVAVIATLLGAPTKDWALLKRWSDDTVEGFKLLGDGAIDGGVAVKVMNAVTEMRAWCESLFRQRRGALGADVLTRLLEPDDGESLTDEELFWFAQLLLVAGNETTTNLMGNLVLALADDPEQWDLLRERPDLVPSAVEEALRYDSPIQGFHRTALDDYEVRGQVIPKGARVLLLYGAANRDPEAFDDPDRFLVERNPQDHMAFSSGVHFCLGANVARRETAIMLSELTERCRSIKAAGVCVRTTNPTVRGLVRLPIELSALDD